MEENKIKKSRRASEFADPYSIEGEEKYPAKLMRKRSKEYFRRSVPSERNNFGRPVTNERNSSGNSVPTCSEGNEREQNIPDRRPIQHFPENKKNEASSTAVSYEFNVDEEADYYAIYKRSLIQTRSFLALDSSMTVYVVLDFDTERKVLLKSLSQLVYRKDMNFYCSCDENRRQYLENIDSIVEQEADLYHPPCFHVKAVREIYEMFVCSNDLDERHSLNESAVKDHRYSMDQISDFQECNIMEIPFMEDVYAICIKAKYGIVKIGFGNIRCITCKQRSDCSHAKYLNDLFIKFENQELPEILEKIDMKLFKYSNTSYQLSCLSTKRIPFYLTQELRERISQSPEDVLIKEDGIFKALTVMESDNCPSCGTLFDPDYVDQKQRTQCILLTRYKMEEVQSYNKVCSHCSSLFPYDGQEDCFLNMGRFLVHYEVLRDYMFQFLFSRCTMYSFYTVWSWHQRDSGNKEFERTFSYTYFRWSWYSFMRLLDLDMKTSFHCDECGIQPGILLFDGTTLSFQRSFLRGIDYDNNQSTEKLQGSSHSQRVFIQHAKTRHAVSEFANKKKQTQITEFREMYSLVKHYQPVLVPLMDNFEAIGCTNTCPDEFRSFLKVLSSNSAICGTFQAEHVDLIRQLLEIDVSTDNHLLQNIQKHIPVLFQLITDIKTIPKFLLPVFEEIISKAEFPFQIKPHERNKVNDNEDFLTFYPNLPKLYERGQFKMDKEKTSQICTKKSSGHPSLLPGIFTVFSQHGICYGFELMESAESPNRPFTFLRTRFHDPPDVVIYDNACNLHNYCLNRDPGYFKNSLFVVDGLHWDNHTACAIGYKALSYPLMKNINTQVVEQNNAKLKKLKSSLSYMKPENFIDTLAFFLWYCNEDCKNKNAVKKKGKELPVL